MNLGARAEEYRLPGSVDPLGSWHGGDFPANHSDAQIDLGLASDSGDQTPITPVGAIHDTESCAAIRAKKITIVDIPFGCPICSSSDGRITSADTTISRTSVQG